MNFNFIEQISLKSNSELVAIYRNPTDYQTEFVELAKQEIIRRNIPIAALDDINDKRQATQTEKEAIEAETSTIGKQGSAPFIGLVARVFNSMRKLISYFKRAFRLSLSFKKQELLVWKDLKELHTRAKWNSGVYENEKSIEATFEIGEEEAGTYCYTIYYGQFYCRVKILHGFSSDLATEAFILAQHFNNLLTDGVVTVDVQNQSIEFLTKCESLIPLLYKGEIYNQIIKHHKISRDVYYGFQKLVNEGEPPAIIIADVLRKNKEKNELSQKDN